MTADVVTVPASLRLADLVRDFFLNPGPRRHPAYPVLDAAGRFLGVVTRSNLLEHWLLARADRPADHPPFGHGPIIAYDLIDVAPVVAHPSETCREAAERMARAGIKRLPVVDPEDPGRLVGIVVIGDLLQARQRIVIEEDERERFFGQRGAAGGLQTR